MDHDVTIGLTKYEALVLFDWLARMDQDKRGASVGDAEQRILWAIECQLESKLVEPLEADYDVKLAEAKRVVLADTD